MTWKPPYSVDPLRRLPALSWEIAVVLDFLTAIRAMRVKSLILCGVGPRLS